MSNEIVQLPAATREYLRIPVTADVELDNQPVRVRFLLRSSDTVVGWRDAEWVGDPATTRTARILIAGPAATGNPGGTTVLAVGSWDVQVKVDDNPEKPVLDAGHVTIS